MSNSLHILSLTFAPFLTLKSSAQHPTYRSPRGYRNQGLHYKAIASLGVGAETVIAFLPKVSIHAYIPRQEFVYGGVDVCLGTFGFSSTLGATIGCKYKILILENSFSRTSVFQSHALNKIWLSNNPKIGIEIDKFMFKIGPSFILREYNGHHDILDWFRIGSHHFNIEIAYIFNSD